MRVSAVPVKINMALDTEVGLRNFEGCANEKQNIVTETELQF